MSLVDPNNDEPLTPSSERTAYPKHVDFVGDEPSVSDTSETHEDHEFVPTLATCHPSQFVNRQWVKATNGMRKGITRAVVAIAVHAATHPWLWILLVFAVSGGFLAAGLTTNFYMELEMMDLFTPTTSKSRRHRGWALDGSKLHGSIATNVPFVMIIHAKGENVITYEGVERAFEVWRLATSIEGPGIDHLCTTYDDDNVIDLDVGYTGECDFQAVTAFWNHNQALFESQVSPNEDVTSYMRNKTYPDGTTVDMDRLFGNLQVGDDGVPLSAEALLVEIAVPFNSQWLWDNLFDYAHRLQEGTTELRKTWASSGSDYSVEFVFDYSIAVEFQQTIFSDFPLIPVVFFIMLGFCCCVFWKRDRVQSRLLLAFGAVSTVGFSLATGFGLMFVLGVPYTVVTNILPYIIFGVGLDDTFIIHGAYERTDPKKPILDRIEEVFQEVGLSITMTTLTTALAFGLGCISTVPAIRDLCYYAWPTVLIDGFYQVSFFVSLVVLDERRIQANRMDCCPCFVASRPSTAIDSDGSTDSNSDDDGDDDDNNNHTRSTRAAKLSGEENSKTPIWSERIMGWYADQLLRPWVKAGVLLVFAAFFGGLAYSSTLLRQDFSFYDLLPSDSPTRSYLSSVEGYGGYSGHVFVYFRGLNQSNAEVQDQMIDFIDQIAAIEHVELQPFCWVRDFRALMEDPSTFVEYLMEDPGAARLLEQYPEVTQFLESEAAASTIDGLTFNQLLDLLFKQPLIEHMYGLHVKRDENGDVHTSRCTVHIKDLDYNSVGGQVALLKAQNEVTDNHPINQHSDEYHAFLYKDIFHLWEFFDVAMQELRFTAVVGIVTVTTFAFLFVPHWSAVFYVFPLMCVLYVNLLGLFQALGLTVNVLTYVTLVVSVGLLVDFLMHALLRYFESTKGTREERVKDMLTTMGASILLGGLSTFLGTIPLVFSRSAVFRTVYISFFSMISLGVSHGLVLLPVLLSMFGTTKQTAMKNPQLPEQQQEHEETKTLAYPVTTTPDGEVEVKNEEPGSTQNSSASLSNASSDTESPLPPFPTIVDAITSNHEDSQMPNSPIGSMSVLAQDYDCERNSSLASTVIHVVKSCNTYDQFEITMN